MRPQIELAVETGAGSSALRISKADTFLSVPLQHPTHADAGVAASFSRKRQELRVVVSTRPQVRPGHDLPKRASSHAVLGSGCKVVVGYMLLVQRVQLFMELHPLP